MITGNKGEWSEVYTLLKILSDRKLYAGDSDLNKVEGLIYPIIKVLRDESSGSFEFGYDDDLVIINRSNEEDSETFRIPISTFQEQAHHLLTEITKGEGSFSVPETEEFMNSYKSGSIKAKSTIKSDIQVVLYDRTIGTHSKLGFSIKSQLKSPSTLLNASGATNFKYEIKNLELTETQIEEINSINPSQDKIKKRVAEILKLGGEFKFSDLTNKTFKNNLTLIDSKLPEIIAYSLVHYYSSNSNKVVDVINKTSEENPMGFDLAKDHPFYSYKFKHFLTDTALGMMPATVWTGVYDATGGYLIVKSDGDILCYHIYNRNEFEDYLFYNTKFETPGSGKHGFGSIYKEDNRLFFNLNLQIRFIR